MTAAAAPGAAYTRDRWKKSRSLPLRVHNDCGSLLAGQLESSWRAPAQEAFMPAFPTCVRLFRTCPLSVHIQCHKYADLTRLEAVCMPNSKLINALQNR